MSAPLKAALTIVLVCSAPLMADWGTPCDAAITELPQLAQLVSIARCTYDGLNGQQATDVTVRGEMTGAGGERDVCIGTGYCGMSTVTSSYNASTTYTATGKFFASQMGFPISDKTVTDSYRTPDPQRPHDAPNDPLQPNAPTCGDPGVCSPIVFNLGNGGYALTNLEDGVHFDIRALGTPIRTAWTARGARMGFLALDRNGNGRVDSGAELFGNRTRLRDGSFASTGFAALAEFDANGDAIVDDGDAAWRDLSVWMDLNHNGESEADEMLPVSASGVTAVSLEHHWTGRVDGHGNSFRYKGKVTYEGRPQSFYDIWFVTEQ